MAYEGYKDQSAKAPDTPLQDVNSKYRQGAVGGRGQVFPPSDGAGKVSWGGDVVCDGSLGDEQGLLGQGR